MEKKIDPRLLDPRNIRTPEEVDAKLDKKSEEAEPKKEPFNGRMHVNVTPRECGECQLCCDLLRVTEIEKEDWKRCEHQCDKGCAIYEKRPETCRDFVCAWLVDESGILKDEHRPDKIEVVYTVQEHEGAICVVAHTLKFASVLQTRVAKINKKIIARFGPVTVVSGDDEEVHTIRQ